MLPTLTYEEFMFAKKYQRQFFALAVLTGLSSCAPNHQAALHSTADRELTIGIVQRDIHVGMSQADVSLKLGSPNIVTKDASAVETWVYDKISSESSYSNSSGGGGIGAVAGGLLGGALLGGGAGGSYDRNTGAAASTQKTLTVVIKFDASSRVKDVQYHTSKF